MEDEELSEVEESEFEGELGEEGESLYDPYGESGDDFFDGSLGMDDQDPYDDPSGYLIDDLGDDDADFEDDDFDFYDEGDFEEG